MKTLTIIAIISVLGVIVPFAIILGISIKNLSAHCNECDSKKECERLHNEGKMNYCEQAFWERTND